MRALRGCGSMTDSEFLYRFIGQLQRGTPSMEDWARVKQILARMAREEVAAKSNAKQEAHPNTMIGRLT